MLDEEYLEWADVLSSARQASVREQPFRMAAWYSLVISHWKIQFLSGFEEHPTISQEFQVLKI